MCTQAKWLSLWHGIQILYDTSWGSHLMVINQSIFWMMTSARSYKANFKAAYFNIHTVLLHILRLEFMEFKRITETTMSASRHLVYSIFNLLHPNGYESIATWISYEPQHVAINSMRFFRSSFISFVVRSTRMWNCASTSCEYWVCAFCKWRIIKSQCQITSKFEHIFSPNAIPDRDIF